MKHWRNSSHSTLLQHRGECDGDAFGRTAAEVIGAVPRGERTQTVTLANRTGSRPEATEIRRNNLPGSPSRRMNGSKRSFLRRHLLSLEPGITGTLVPFAQSGRCPRPELSKNTSYYLHSSQPTIDYEAPHLYHCHPARVLAQPVQTSQVLR